MSFISCGQTISVRCSERQLSPHSGTWASTKQFQSSSLKICSSNNTMMVEIVRSRRCPSLIRHKFNHLRSSYENSIRLVKKHDLNITQEMKNANHSARCSAGFRSAHSSRYQKNIFFSDRVLTFHPECFIILMQQVSRIMQHIFRDTI